MYRSIIFALVCTCLLGSCIPSPVYQKAYAIPKNQWEYAYKPSFKFEITDTTSLYNIYFLVRHTEAYPFSNIWLQIHTKGPGDTAFKMARIEVPLAEPTGKWLGRGMGEISEQRMPITMEGDTAILRKKGTWEIKLEQNMRVNPLPDILQVGLRIEKANSIPNY